jgi:hypothetical protein
LNPQYILIVAVIIVMGWFAFGVIYNLRRGDALLKWMQQGLPDIGQRTTFRWLGTSVADMEIAHAKQPFRRLQTLLVLKPRDLLWMTLLAAFQGREDIVVFRAQLSTPPLFDLELVDPKAWTGRSAMRQAAGRNWESREYHGLQLLAPRGMLDAAAAVLDRLAFPMQSLSARYARLSLRRETPNFEVHLPFPEFRSLDAGAYFAALRDLALAVTGRD